MRKRSDFEENLAEILGSNSQLAPGQVALLADLTKKESVFFKQAWMNADEERKRQVMSHLIKLHSDNFYLDFTRVFLACLEDSDENIRSQAIMAFEGEEDASIITPLVRLLREDNSEKVRVAAAIALGQFALLAAVKKLLPARSTEIYSNLLTVIEGKHETDELKRRCLEAVAPLGSPQVKELIEQAYRSDDVKVKASALYAMGRNCDPAWLPIIIEEKDNSEPMIRYEVAEACGELGREETVSTLVELAGDGDIQVRKASVRALEQIDGPRARQALRQLLNSPHQDVREVAQEALEELEIFGLFDL